MNAAGWFDRFPCPGLDRTVAGSIQRMKEAGAKLEDSEASFELLEALDDLEGALGGY